MTHALITYFNNVPEEQDENRYKDIQTLIDLQILDEFPQYESRLYHLFEVMYGIQCLHTLPSFDDIPMHVLPKHIILKAWVLPIIDGDNLTLGIYDPKRIQQAYQLYSLTNKKIKLLFIQKSIFISYYNEFNAYIHLQNAFQDVSKLKPVETHQSMTLDQNKPFIKYSDELLNMSRVMHASDIHFTQNSHKGYVKFRIHGVLKTYHSHDLSIHKALIRRYKVLSKCHVGIDHYPQDGMFYRTHQDTHYMYRMSTIPTFFGEHMIIRAIDLYDAFKSMKHLGLTHNQYDFLKHMLQRKEGLILVCGTTGSGKSTTIHAMIDHMKKDIEHIVTIEDPIEKIIEGATQIKINEAQHLSYEKALKHILRIDPDIVVIGEIRDEMSAKVALRASLTGHVVLSTIHAQSPTHIVERLKHFNISHALHHTVKLMMFQTLIPLICHICEGQGCQVCKHTGVSKRQALFEIYVYDKKESNWIKKGATISDSVNILYDERRISKETYTFFINSFES